MMLCDTRKAAKGERQAIERALGSVDGVVLSSSRMPDSGIRMIAKQVPTVVLNRVLPDVHSVVVDNPRGARRAMEHLGSLGHDSVTYLAGPEESWPDGVRWLAEGPSIPAGSWSALEAYSAEELTRVQCEIFDQVLDR